MKAGPYKISLLENSVHSCNSHILVATYQSMASAAFLQTAVDKLAGFILEKLEEERTLLCNFENDLSIFRSEIQDLQGYLADAETKSNARADVTRTLQLWLSRVGNAIFSAENIFDECLLYDMEEASRNHSNFCIANFKKFWFRHRIGWKIKDMKEKIQSIKNDPAMEHLTKADVNDLVISSSGNVVQHDMPVLYDKGVGVEERVGQVIGKLGDAGSVAVVGMGGLGKTFLLKHIFDRRKDLGYSDSAWLCVSQNYSLGKLQQSLWNQIKHYNEKDFPDGLRVDAGQRRIFDRLRELGKWLIVLDDVWKADDELSRRLGIPENKEGCCLLVSTRDKDVAKEQTKGFDNSHIYEMSLLSEDESWDLFCKKMEIIPPHLSDLANEIVKQCKMHPLTIITTAASLFGTTSRPHWESRLQALKSLVNFHEDDPHDKVLRRLRLSYDALPSSLKLSFTSFAMLEEDFVIECRDIVWRWVGEGVVKRQGNDTVENAYAHLRLLSQKCLIEVYQDEDLRKKCRMHDLLHQLACQIFAENKGLLAKENGPELTQNMDGCHTLQVSLVQNSHVDSVMFPPCLRSLEVSLYIDDNLTLKQALKKAKALRVLNLNGTKTDQIMSMLSEAKLKHLTCLGISLERRNFVGSEVVKEFDLIIRAGADMTLPSVPDSIKSMKLLTSLSLGLIVELPEWIGDLQYLQQLEFHGYVKAPKRMKQLTKLMVIANNRRGMGGGLIVKDEASDSMMTLHDLSAFIDLREVKIDLDGQLGDTFPSLPRLTRLSLSHHTRYLQVPNSISSQIPNLEELSLCRVHVPKSLGSFHQLERLDIVNLEDPHGFEGCGLETLCFLRYLQICNVGTFVIPKEWSSTGAFAALQVLKIQSTIIEDPFEFETEGCMPKITRLSLDGVTIKARLALPKRIFQVIETKSCQNIHNLIEC